MNKVTEMKNYVDLNILQYLEGIKSNFESELFEAVMYGVVGRGKRLRPIMMLLSAEAVGEKKERFINLAMAVEFIHSYSLIHDDLPALDNDNERSGRPSMHKKFSEATAILAGDTLLNLAYQLMIDSIIKDPMLLGAVKYIADSAGYRGMIGGQVMDLASSAINGENVLLMYVKKTGALISASVLSPLFVARSDEDTFNAFGRFATSFSIAFQLSDDLLDIKSGQDDGSVTFATINGIDDTEATLKFYRDEIAGAFDVVACNATDLIDFSNTILDRLS